MVKISGLDIAELTNFLESLTSTDDRVFTAEEASKITLAGSLLSTMYYHRPECVKKTD